jgi:hypothetical protein
MGEFVTKIINKGVYKFSFIPDIGLSNRGKLCQFACYGGKPDQYRVNPLNAVNASFERRS